MVFLDISSYSAESYSQDKNALLKIASISDRFSAFVFDVILLIPLLGLFLAPIYKKVQFLYYVEPSSTEFFVLCLVLFVSAAALTAFIQSVFLIFLSATPGKYFFKLRVVSITEEKPHWSSYILRSFLWVGEVVFFFIPFLAVLSETSRRPLHDRAAGTMVVTLKQEADLGPYKLETHFVRQIMILLSLFLVAWSLTFFQYLYNLASNGDFKKSDAIAAMDSSCQGLIDPSLSGKQRMDISVSLYLTRQISEDCFMGEADHALWAPSKELNSWGYLAKAIYYSFDKDKSEEYFEKACLEKGEACRLALSLNNKNYLENSDSFSSKVISLTQFMRIGQYEKSLDLLNELVERGEFSDFVASKKMQIMWMQGQQDKALGAFELIKDLSSPAESQRVSAWLCLEQLDTLKADAPATACQILKATYLTKREWIEDPYVGLALITEKINRNSTALDWVQFKKLFEKHTELAQLTKALSKDSGMKKSERQKALQVLAKEGSFEALRERAWLSWLNSIDNKAEMNLLKAELQNMKRRDLFWKKANQLADTKFPESNRLPASTK